MSSIWAIVPEYGYGEPVATFATREEAEAVLSALRDHDDHPMVSVGDYDILEVPVPSQAPGMVWSATYNEDGTPLSAHVTLGHAEESVTVTNRTGYPDEIHRIHVKAATRDRADELAKEAQRA